MAVLNNVADLNALLKKKGIEPVTNTTEYRLTPTREEIRAYQEQIQNPLEPMNSISEEQLFMQQVIENVIQHYCLDQTPGFYGDEERDGGKDKARQIRQGIVYQVLNQPQILFEFFKKQCYDTHQLERLNRFNDYYVLAVEDAKRMN